MVLSINSCNSRALDMQLYARRLLQEAATAALPPAPSPNHDPAAQRAAGSGDSSSTPEASSNGSAGPFNVGSQFSPTMVIILVILLSAFFFMGFFAIYVRRCTSDDNFTQRGNPRGGGASRRHDVNSGPQRGLGVDASLLESFPMVSYAAAKRKGCNECVVCLAEFETGEELKQLPKCKHVFHPDCIGMWLESHTTCPLCRRSLVNSDRWSMSWRWGGSSRGVSSSTRLNYEGDSSHMRMHSASPVRLGRARSGSSHSGANQEGGELAPTAIPGSPLVASSAPASLTHSRSMEIVSGCVSCMGSDVAVQGGAGPMTNNSTSRLASEVGGGLRAAPQGGRRRLGRSNSTGHSLRKDVMSRAAAAAAAMQGGSLVGCMPRMTQLSLHRSRSIALGEEEEVGMAEKGSVSGGGCSRGAGARQ